jgi:hypothetical protein
VFGIEVIPQDGAEKRERLDAPLATEILDLILWNWNARRDLPNHGQNHITAPPQDRPNFRLAFQSATGSMKPSAQRALNPRSRVSSPKAKCARTIWVGRTLRWMSPERSRTTRLNCHYLAKYASTTCPPSDGLAVARAATPLRSTWPKRSRITLRYSHQVFPAHYHFERNIDRN